MPGKEPDRYGGAGSSPPPFRRGAALRQPAALRELVVQRKIIGTLRNEKGIFIYETLPTLLENLIGAQGAKPIGGAVEGSDGSLGKA